MTGVSMTGGSMTGGSSAGVSWTGAMVALVLGSLEPVARVSALYVSPSGTH